MIRKENELRKLDDILKYAIEYIPFYKGKKEKKIECFPIIKKENIKSNYSSFLSDEIDDKERLVDCLESEFNIDKYVIEKKYSTDILLEWTSGTSGVPFKCIKTIQERKNISLNMWKMRMQVDSCITPSKFLPIIHTGILPFQFDIRDYSYDNVKNMYEYIGKRGVTCIHISPTILQRHLSQSYFNRISIPETLKYIESTGRYLDENTKCAIENRFDVKVLNMYGTIETWGIAETCKYNNMHINSDNVYLELVDEEGEVFEEYNRVGRVVITALNQFKMPFIRYKTSDYAMIVNEQCYCGQKQSIKLCKCRENQYIYVEKKKVSGENFMRKILRKVEYEKVFQDMAYIMLCEKSDNKYELFLNYLSEAKTFEKLFTKFLSEELRRNITIIFRYVSEAEFAEVNPKGYIFMRKS